MVFQELDAVKVKGKNEPVSIYAPLGEHATLPEASLSQLEQWDEFLAAFRAQKWQLARERLTGLQGSVVTNPTLHALYENRIEYFELNFPPENWDGVTQFDTK
jgi:adenylate cyclase